MSIGLLEREGDLQRFLQDELQKMGLDGAFVQRNNDLSGVLALAVGGKLRLAHGSASVTYTASASSAPATVPHGLVDGRGQALTPLRVVPGVTSSPTLLHGIYVTARDATNITFEGRCQSALTGTINFDWIAVG